MDFRTFAFPNGIEKCRKFCVAITNQTGRLNADIVQPHGGITSLLKNPLIAWIESRGTHENFSATEVDKYQDIGINPASPCKNRFAEKIAGNQGLHMGTNKLFPVTGRILFALSGTG